MTDLVKQKVVNKEIAVPKTKVTANPLIGPDPNSYRTPPPIRVVIFESTMVIMAILYPCAIAIVAFTPCLIS